MSKSKDQGPPSSRDSGSGRFVTEDYAKRHPRTTETEHNRPKPPSGPKKK
jgi:hypothetical protein